MIIDNTVDFKSTPVKGTELLLGSGRDTTKQMALYGKPQEWQDVITLDMTSENEPDVVWNLEDMPLPFEDESFDEIHAYEVLEHIGKQGDWKFFFKQFDEFSRILRPGGHVFATTPMWDSIWAWSDPGHTRVISQGNLLFLDRDRYNRAAVMTDYRPYFKCDFEIIHAKEFDERFTFILRKK